MTVAHNISLIPVITTIFQQLGEVYNIVIKL